MVKRYDRNYPLDTWFNGETHQIRAEQWDVRPQSMRAHLREYAKQRGIYLEACIKNRAWVVIKAHRLSSRVL